MLKTGLGESHLSIPPPVAQRDAQHQELSTGQNVYVSVCVRKVVSGVQVVLLFYEWVSYLCEGVFNGWIKTPEWYSYHS